MVRELDGFDQATVDQVVESLEPDGVTGSAAWVSLREAVAVAGRSAEWNDAVAGVCEAFEARSPAGAEAIAPAFLGSVFRELTGTADCTVKHYDALTVSWRAHVGRTHPEDGSPKSGEVPVLGCGPRDEPMDWSAHDWFPRT